MQTRREQVRAYRFVNRRMVSALLSGDPESQDLPMRRLGLALFGSVMVAAIVLAGVAIYGVYNPGGGTLANHTLLIERETGANYVYLDDQLYPVLNFASARLVLGDAAPTQQTVSQATLRGHARGPTLGIPNAPDALPAAKSLSSLPWSVCGASTLNGSGATQLMIGGQLTGGAQLGESSLLVESGGSSYLIWHNHRLQISSTGIAALQIAQARPVPIGPAVLNAMDAGPALQAPTVYRSGDATTHVYAGKPAKVGDVFRSGEVYYVLLTDGLAPINQVTARLMRADQSIEPPVITPTDVGASPSKTVVEPPGWPTAMPTAINSDPAQTALCASYRGTSVTVEYFPKMPAGLSTAPATGTDNRGVRLADHVVVDGGRGAIVQTLPVPGATTTGTTTYLVTDEGIKYSLATAEAKTALGYGDVTPTLIPAALLALLPTGPVLDIAAARNFTTRAG